MNQRRICSLFTLAAILLAFVGTVPHMLNLASKPVAFFSLASTDASCDSLTSNSVSHECAFRKISSPFSSFNKKGKMDLIIPGNYAYKVLVHSAFSLFWEKAAFHMDKLTQNINSRAP